MVVLGVRITYQDDVGVVVVAKQKEIPYRENFLYIKDKNLLMTKEKKTTIYKYYSKLVRMAMNEAHIYICLLELKVM